MSKSFVLDIETDSLTPSKIYVIVCRDIDTGKVSVFREGDWKAFAEYLVDTSFIVAHNGISFDIPVINKLLASWVSIDFSIVIDTLVVSRLLDTNILGGHSLAAWGNRLGFPKYEFHDFSKYSLEMEKYCIQDTLVTLKLYEHFKNYIYSPLWKKALRCEHDTALICNDMRANGFHFDKEKARELYLEISRQLSELDNQLSIAFPPKSSLIKEITPKATKHGTLSRTDFRWVTDGDLTPFSVGSTFSRIEFIPFNAGSPKQVVSVLNEAGWKPVEKTKGYIEAEKELSRCKDQARKAVLKEKIKNYQVYGWTVSEKNLETLPDKADTPDAQIRLEAARKLAERLILQNRYTVLRDWLEAVDNAPNGSEASSEKTKSSNRYWSTHVDKERIHGNFNHIGAWTHRMSHSEPNMANIPTFGGLPKDREPSFIERWKSCVDPQFRQLWGAPKGKLLVGVDAESIQLRILAHYMNDPRFTESLLSGKKEDKTDPHSMNQKALGSVCQTRDDAKTFIYAWLLGAGFLKVSQILKCTVKEAEEANDSFLAYYPGLEYLKKVIIPQDAQTGYFQGFDGRFVKCDSEHLMLAGYLQNGESCIMKHANILWRKELDKEKIPYKQVNFVHDEYQTEIPDDLDLAIYVAQKQSEAIKKVGEMFNLNCPMAGSFKGDHGINGYSIGYNWYMTH